MNGQRITFVQTLTSAFHSHKGHKNKASHTTLGLKKKQKAWKKRGMRLIDKEV